MAGFFNQNLEKSGRQKRFNRLRFHALLEYCYNHPTSNAGWSVNATIPKFDPELGKLMSAKLSISYNINYNLKITNQGNNSANVIILDSGENRTLLSNPSSVDDFLSSSSGDNIVFPVSVITLNIIQSNEVIMTQVILQANASICIICEFSSSDRKGVING
jgi:hypothetical protein